jgi:hypothetical protein
MLQSIVRRSLAASLFVLSSLASARAYAADPGRPLRELIRVEPGATCLDAAALVDDVQTWLGTDTADPGLSIEVRGSPDQPRVVEFRTWVGGRVIAHRAFSPAPERCEHLHAALGLAIAMAIRASLFEEIAGAMEEARPRAPEAPPARIQRWAIGADALGALGVLPGASFGAEVRIERALGPTFRARLGVLGLVALGEAFPRTPGTFDAGLVAPRLDLCAAFAVSSRVWAEGCMGLAGGALYANGHAFPSSTSALVPWIAAANGIDLAVDLAGSWSLDASVSVTLPLSATSLVVRDFSGNVIDQRDLPHVGGFLGIGPVYRF